MTIKKLTILDQIEVTRSGDIGVRFAKQIVDGTEVIATEWHRTLVERGGDVSAQLAAVSSHLKEGLGYPEIKQADIERIQSIAKAAWV